MYLNITSVHFRKRGRAFTRAPSSFRLLISNTREKKTQNETKPRAPRQLLTRHLLASYLVFIAASLAEFGSSSFLGNSSALRCCVDACSFFLFFVVVEKKKKRSLVLFPPVIRKECYTPEGGGGGVSSRCHHHSNASVLSAQTRGCSKVWRTCG